MSRHDLPSELSPQGVRAGDRVKLTDRAIAALTCPTGRKDKLFFDVGLKSFGLRVTAGGTRIFLFQYRAGGAVRRKPIGEWPHVTAALARKTAERLRGATQGGTDPIAEERAAKAVALAERVAAQALTEANSFTVAKLIDQWQAIHLAERSPAYRAEAPKRLRGALTPWIDTPVAHFDRGAAVSALDASVGHPIQANRIRAYARACFGWAVKRGALTASPFAALPKAVKEMSRDRVLSDSEVGLVWLATCRIRQPWSTLIRLLLLTGQRRGEVAGMRWSELSPDLRTWTIPAHRAKNGRASDVPLVPAVVELLAAVPRIANSDLVFSQRRNTAPCGFAKAKERLDALTGPMPAWTLHDLRRTVATGLQRAGVRLEVTEACLNHVSGSRSGIVGVYQRHAWTKEKREALEGWAAHVLAVSDSGSSTAPGIA